MEVVTLASGSSGNCTLVRTAHGAVLIDAGISCKQIAQGLQALGLTLSQLKGILVTHEHSDHIKGLQVLLKRQPVPIYTSAPTGRQLVYRIAGIQGQICPISAGTGFTLGGLDVLPFSTPHDAAGSLGFTFSDGKGRAAVATDMGHVTEEVRNALSGCDLAVIETNYEHDWLLDGPYSYSLKQRILGDYGHLSNRDGGALACDLAEQGTKTLILGHLSDKNNAPAQAEGVVRTLLKERGIRPGVDVRLEVAPRYVSGPVHRV